MTQVILFDNEVRDHLLPLTFVRPVGELRIGILTIAEKWARQLGHPISFLTQDYLADKYPMTYTDDNLLINGALLPSPQLLHLIKGLEPNEALLQEMNLLAARLDGEQVRQLIEDEDFGELRGYEVELPDLFMIERPYDIFRYNDRALREDFALLTADRSSAPLSATNTLIGPADQLFIEQGATIEACTLNTTNGPIYIGRDVLVMEGGMIRGPLALCEGTVLKMGAKVYGATTLGPYCKVGGEVNNVVMLANSNKSHDGYLGNAVLAEWCNLGADTNSSNLKNTYEEVKVWNYVTERFAPSGLQFCGLIMGDHSKCAISTSFNTGTVVGVCANIFGTGFPRQFIPSFAWGGAQGFSTYRIDKAYDTIERVMQRRKQDFDLTERLILLRVYEETARFRRWEKQADGGR